MRDGDVVEFRCSACLGSGARFYRPRAERGPAKGPRQLGPGRRFGIEASALILPG